MKQAVYISSSENKSIEVWNLHEKGDLNCIQKITTDGEVQPIEIIANQKLLYSGVRPNNRIISYFISKNGCLKKADEICIPGSPNYISFDCNQKFLFSSSYHFNCISVSPLNKNGLPQNSIQNVYNIKGCHAAKFNHKYKILLVTALKSDCIYLYYFTKSGLLKNTEQKYVSVQKKSGPRHIAIHPNQDYFYTINELKNTIDAWKLYNKKNVITVKNIQTAICNVHNSTNYYWGSDIHITSCGRFLYTADRASSTLSLFHVEINNNNHNIIFIENYITTEQPRSFCIDYYNKYLLIIGQKSNILVVYSICKNTGKLNKIKEYNTGKNPLWIKTNKLYV